MNKKDELNKLKYVLINKIKLENNDRYKELSTDEVMKIVIDASNKGKYVFWVLREYLKGNIQRFEDIGRVKQTLILFKNNLSKFTEQQKQLNKMSFQELETLVSPYQDVLTQNAVKRIQKEKIWSEIDIIHEGPKGKIYSPKTKEASIFLGQGTRWCTASVNGENYFDYYNEQGPLYIFVTNEKDEEGREMKYQLHFESRQFMDSEDYEISFCDLEAETNLLENLFFSEKISDKAFESLFFDYFSDFFKDKNNHDRLSLKQKLILSCSSLDTIMNFNFIPELKDEFIIYNINKAFFSFDMTTTLEKEINNFTDEQKIAVLKKNSKLISFIKNPTEEMKWISIKDNVFNEQYIRDMTYDMYKYIYSKKPQSFLTMISDEMKIRLMRDGISAVNILNIHDDSYSVSNKSDVKRLKERERSKGKFSIFDTSNPELRDVILNFIGEGFINLVKNPTKEMCLHSVKKNGLTLIHIENPTEEMKLEAVKENGNAIALIDNPTEEVKWAAIKQNGNALWHIRGSKTSKMIAEAIRNSDRPLEISSFFRDLKQEDFDYEIAMKMVKSYPMGVEYVPKNLIDEELALEAIKRGCGIYHIPEKFRTKELVLKAIDTVPSIISYFEKDEEIIFSALRKNGFCLQYIRYQTEEMRLEAVKQNGLVLQCIREPSDKIKLEAIKQNCKALNFIEKPTDEMIFTALKNGYTTKSTDINVTNFIRKNTNKFSEEELLLFLEYFDIFDAIKNPSKKIYYKFLEEIYKSDFDIEYPFKDCPYYDVKLEMIKKYPYILKYISEYTEEMCIEAVKQDGEVIKFISNPTYEMELEATKQNHKMIDVIKNINDEIMLIYLDKVLEETRTKDNIDLDIYSILKYVNPEKSETLEYIIEKTKNNKILNYYFKNLREKRLCHEQTRRI